MIFFDLPIEVGILIFNYLDIKSKINVYNSSLALRRFFAPCHFKKIVLSRSTVARANTLKQDFFVDFGQHIQELNFSGVADLSADKLRIHIPQFINLRTLDLTFTNIYLSDLPEVCPEGLKNISINFFKCPRRCVRDGIWEKCRSVFKEKLFDYVHFIIFEFLDSDTPLLFLKGLPSTRDLKITVADNYKDFWELEDVPLSLEDDIEVNFSKLSYLFRDCRVTHKTSKCLRGVSNLGFEKLEYIFIMYLEKIIIYISPVFRSTFFVNCSDLRVEISTYLPLDFMLDGNIIFKAWNKAMTTFDEQFFTKLTEEFKDYFPSYICMHSKIKMVVTNSPSDWYCIDSCDGFENSLEYLPNKVTLTDFCRRDGSVIRCNRPITLSPNSETLKNLTFLRLSNICIRNDFFTILFFQCHKLTTLDIYVEKRGRLGMFRGYILSLSKSIHLAKSLRNIKLTSEDIEYEILFDTLSRCPTLENIHICEYERALGDGDVDVSNILLLIERCECLYSLFIEADMSPEALTMLICPLRETAQRLERDHLCIEVSDCYRGWNPFVNVFNPSPLHILD